MPVSKTAEPYLEDLLRRGATAAELVELNDLGREHDAAKARGLSSLSAPRTAWLGTMLVREPSVEARVWAEEVSPAIPSSLTVWLDAYASLADPPEGYPMDSDKARHAVARLRGACRATPAEVDAALMWVWRADEKAEEPPPRDAEPPMDALWGMLMDAVGALGIPAETLARRTPAEIAHSLRSSHRLHGFTLAGSPADAAYFRFAKRLQEIGEAADARRDKA